MTCEGHRLGDCGARYHFAHVYQQSGLRLQFVRVLRRSNKGLAFRSTPERLAIWTRPRCTHVSSMSARRSRSATTRQSLIGPHPVRAPSVQRRDQPVQLIALLPQVASGRRPVLFADEIALAPGGRELLQHARLLVFGRVHLETVVAQPGGLRSPPDAFERFCETNSTIFSCARQLAIVWILAPAGRTYIVRAALGATTVAICKESAESGANSSIGSMISPMVRASMKLAPDHRSCGSGVSIG
ncbi:hypothetical protein ABIB85_007391 [Bradyrhizobium sp. JR1.5]